jgi:hypothetical protein
MYTHRQRILPALGKEAEVRAQLTDWVKQLQSKGRNIALLQRLFSSEGPGLLVSTRADDLNALEKIRHENLADADWQARAAKLVALLRGSVQSVVAEQVIPGSGSGPVGVVQRALGFAALGKENQFRSITEEFVRSSQAAGVRMGMGVRVYSSTGSVLEVTSIFPDVAALDRTRQERLPITREVVQGLHEISREPILVRLFEVLVPFPN